jgi:2-methylfumaryl-CoA isomerase
VGDRIIEVSAFVAAPLAGMTLAALGYDVIRVDPPGGGLDFGRWPVTPEGDSLFWAGLNRGKASVVVDFRRPAGRELVAAMIEAGGPEGGVFLTNLGARGVLEHTALCQRRSDVVSVEIEGYPDGRSAVDYTIAAQTGIPFVTGPSGHVGPVNSPLPTWDIATGLNAAAATAEALRRRQRTGEGALVRVALSDVAQSVLSALGFVDEPARALEPRSRDGNYLYGAFGRDFLLADGSSVMVVAITLKQWHALIAGMGLAADVGALERSSGLDLDQEGDRYRTRHEIARLVERWCGARSMAEAAEVLDAHGISWAPYREAGDLPGAAGAPPHPVRFDNHAPALGPAPGLGQDTDRVLSEVLGLSPLEIAHLHDEGLVMG